MNPDIAAMFSVDTPGNYMIIIKGVEISESEEYFKCNDVQLVPLDDMMREIEKESNESNYTTES